VTDLVVVATSPARLAGMGFPRSVDWEALDREGYRHVLRLHPGSYDPSPLTVHELVLEDLYGGRLPSDPSAERERVLEASRLAVSWLESGDGVVVHCLGGTGRTGTVLACALLHLGLDADQACRRVQSNLPSWPESAWQEELVRSL
jgi:protein-tyrosine phosphatase